MNATPTHVRMKQLVSILPISRASIWRMVRQGTFPAPIKLSVGITAWRTVDIEEWLNKCGMLSKSANSNTKS